MKKLRIDVTQEDIDSGVSGSFCNCPIASAANRAGNGMLFVTVGQEDITIYPRAWPCEPLFSADLPLEARGFIMRFDKGEPVKPFSFEV